MYGTTSQVPSLIPVLGGGPGASGGSSTSRSKLGGVLNGLLDMDASFPSDGKDDFGLLLADAKRRNAQFDAQGLPRINRRVDQIEADSRKLVAKAARTGDLTNKNRGHYLLARRGYDADKLTRSLNSIDLRTPFEPLEALADTDIEGYLQHQHELTVITAVMEAKKETVANYERRYVASMDAEWEAKKRELLDHFRDQKVGGVDKGPGVGGAGPGAGAGAGAGTGGSLLSMDVSGMAASLQRSTTVMTQKMKAYANVVASVNSAPGGKPEFGIIRAFLETAAALDDRDSRKNEIVDSWVILGSILGESDGMVPAAGMYSAEYERADPRLINSFIRGARSFLETQYRALIETYLDSRTTETYLAGQPTFIGCLKAFVEMKFKNDKGELQIPEEMETYEGYPIWPIVFYALRCGAFDELYQYVESVGESLDLFRSCLFHYLDHEDGMFDLDANSVHAIESEVQSALRRGDKYKKAVFIVLTKREGFMPEIEDMVPSAQDYMWFELSLLKPEPGTQSHAPSLSALQERILSFGLDATSPLLYFQVLLLSLQFEEAVRYLVTSEHYAVEAVHFALALAHYGVMRYTNGTETAALTHTSPSFNLTKLLRRYTRAFTKTNPREALQYLLRLPHTDAAVAGGSTAAASDRFEAIKDLLLETREFKVLLAELQPDGRGSGSSLSAAEFDAILSLAAEDSENTLRYHDAITLYYVAEAFDKVLEILNKLLSKVVAVLNDDRAAVRELASSVAVRMWEEDKVAHVRDRSLIATFNLLQQLMDYFDLYYANKYAEAIELMDTLTLLPASPDDLDDRVDGFRHVHPSVTRILPEILLAEMTAVYKLYCTVKDDAKHALTSRNEGIEHRLDALRGRARLLTTFSGMLQYRMPGDTNAKLLRMEVFMS